MTPASDRKPKVGDRVWREKNGKRYVGRVVEFDKDGDGAGLGEFPGLTEGHDGHLGDCAKNRLFLFPGARDWGFLDPAPEAPKPYEPMVGDVVRLPEGRIVWRDESGDCEIAFNDDPPSASTGIGAGIIARSTLVSRPEKPLQVGEKALTADSRRVVEIVSIFRRRGETFATVEITDRREYEVPFDTVRLDDLRRAPEGV